MNSEQRTKKMSSGTFKLEDEGRQDFKRVCRTDDVLVVDTYFQNIVISSGSYQGVTCKKSQCRTSMYNRVNGMQAKGAEQQDKAERKTRTMIP